MERKRRKSPVTIGREVGTIIGGIGFVYIGLLYGVVYGGYLGLVVAKALFGTPIPPSIWARGLTFLGITLGVVTSAALFIGAGAALGAGVGYLFALALQEARPQKEKVRQPIRIPPLSEENRYARRGRIAGAWVGGALFLSVGFWIGLVYGGEGGLILAASFYGAPVPHTLLARGMVLLGMLFGVLSAGTVCLVMGAVIGTLLGYAISVVLSLFHIPVPVNNERRAES